MIEIETKLKLTSDVTRAELIAKLTPRFTVATSSKHQVDTIFLLPEQVDAPIIPGSKILRVRDVLDPESGELRKSLITLKVEGRTKLVSDEYEFEVSDGKMARAMLVALGWQEVVTVDKLRTESKIDNYSICIDEVAELGLFIELEVLSESDTNSAQIQAEMKAFLEKLNLTGEIWTTPYDTSIRRLRVEAATK